VPALAARGCDERGDRYGRSENGLDDLAHRAVQPAGGIELQHHERGLPALGLLESALDVVDGRRADRAAYIEHQHGSGRCCVGLGCSRALASEQHGPERKQQENSAAHTRHASYGSRECISGRADDPGFSRRRAPCALWRWAYAAIITVPLRWPLKYVDWPATRPASHQLKKRNLNCLCRPNHR
jgi:hypothetical protein